MFIDAKVDVHPHWMDIYSIEGTMFVNEESKMNFNIKIILLCSGKLKNVDYVYGIIIYTVRTLS